MSYNEILNSDISKSKNVIYKFTNLINQKIYIGQTRKQFRERLAHHIWQMNNNPSYFHKALSKYGSLWYPLRRYKEESIELNGFIWMTLESYNKLGKQKVSEQTKR